jgi:hypothetical protein
MKRKELYRQNHTAESTEDGECQAHVKNMNIKSSREEGIERVSSERRVQIRVFGPA